MIQNCLSDTNLRFGWLEYRGLPSPTHLSTPLLSRDGLLRGFFLGVIVRTWAVCLSGACTGDTLKLSHFLITFNWAIYLYLHKKEMI